MIIKNISKCIQFASILSVLASCSATKEMQVLVTRPAIFEIPKNVKKILLINRSKGNAFSIIEGVLTGEIPGTDNVQSEQCMSGLQQILNLNRNLQITRYTTRLLSDRGTSTGFGNPMDWTSLAEISKEYNADAVLVLEFFDTDFFVRDAVGFSRLPDIYVNANCSAKAGFRLYDPNNKTILYERIFSGNRNYIEHSTTRLLAIAKLIKGTNAMNEVSFSTGKNFAKRLVSYDIWEDRLMYKGNKITQKGGRYVIENDWHKGVETWLNAYDSPNTEDEKGKIAFNLALGYEVLGDLQEAKRWITTSYVEHQNSKAIAYSQTINNRIENEGILENQRKK